MKIRLKTAFALSLLLASPQFGQKPNIWIQTDMTAATGYTKDGNSAKAVTDKGSDPDDHVALAIYLMMANRFNTVGIVMGVTNRNTNQNVLTFFNQVFRPAYAEDIRCLNQHFGGYPPADSLKAYESSCTAGSNTIQFDSSPSNKYDSYSALPGTVRLLVDELKSDQYSAEDPLYVCVWGGMTETAMAVKHLIRNSETDALNRLHIVSHWHTSYTNTQNKNNCYSGTLAEIYGVANCNVDCDACKYVRDEAMKDGASFRWTDCASVGQTGIVNGYNNYFNGVDGSVYKRFEKSKLGALFIKSKFVYGKPDGSDCATFYAILGEYGVTLEDYNDNGQTTKAQEEDAKNMFRSKGHAMLNELLSISDIASSGPCDETSVGPASRPASFGILMNYPNPFNPVTAIGYQLSSAGRVRLEIVNTAGHSLAQLVDANQAEGRHEVVWNATDASGQRLPSGVYIACLHASNEGGQYFSTQKMLLMK